MGLFDKNNVFQAVVMFGKIFLPKKYLTYFPPSFIVRNPIVSSLKQVYKDDGQAVIVVFKTKDIHLKTDRVDYEVIKAASKIAIQKHVPKEMVLSVQFWDYESLALLLKIDDEWNNLTSLEAMVTSIIKSIEKDLKQYTIDTGYVVLERGPYSVEESLKQGYKLALAMAEKGEKSQYNEMVFGIRKILKTKSITLLAQPIIDVTTGDVYAYELLTRGPKNSAYEGPLQLFSIARQTKMLYELELLVLEKSFNLLRKTGCPQHIFINFTPMTLGSFRFVKDISEMLVQYPEIKTEQLVIEITERESIDNLELIPNNIKKLRQLGFRIAVDDTGAGYASLETITKIMPDIIKIDRSVIQDIDTNRIKESMLKGLLLIAKEAGSKVVAEGIETKEEANVLLYNKVDFAQGYYFAKPNKMPQSMPTQ